MKRPLLSMAGPRRTGDEVEELRKCLPGQSVAVYYSDDTYWHERVLLLSLLMMMYTVKI